MKSINQNRLGESGNAAVILLIILVAAAAGIFAFKSGKLDKMKPAGDVEQASVTTEEDAKNNPVLAIINGENVKRQEVIDLVNIMPAQMRQVPMEQLFPMALEQLISNKIIDKRAAKAGLGNNKEIRDQLKLTKTQLIRAKFLEKSVNDRINDELLMAEYKKYVSSFPSVDEVKVAHILVDSEKTAKSLIKKLGKGEDFAELAKGNSKDGSAAKGGELGFFTETEVVPEFAKAAFAMKVGEYSQKPVKTDFGYHIIRVDEKRVRPPAEFAKVKPFMEKELQRSILDKMIKEWRAGVEIERFDINGNPLPEAQEPAAGDDAEAASAADDAAAAKEEPAKAGKAE